MGPWIPGMGRLYARTRARLLYARPVWTPRICPPRRSGRTPWVGDARLGVDVGGTFTDLVALVDGELRTAKVPSTPGDQSEGVMAAVAAAGLRGEDVGAFAHGMTVGTNALLERRGARTALVTTEGFRDVLEIGRQMRPSLYDLTEDRPAPLVPRDLRFTVPERMAPDGVVRPLDDDALRGLVAEIAAADVEAVAVCLLFGFLHPEHERKAGEALRDGLDGVRVTLSSDVQGLAGLPLMLGMQEPEEQAHG